MSDINNTSQSHHFFSYEAGEQRQFKKRHLRRPFNAEDHLEGINDLMNKVEKIFLKLTSAYTKNAIFEINRQHNLYYDVVIKLSNQITNVLKDYSSQIPKENRENIAENIETLKLATLVLKQDKNEWRDKFSQSNDPEFDPLAIKNEEKLNELLFRIEEVESLDKSVENRDVNTLKL